MCKSRDFNTILSAIYSTIFLVWVVLRNWRHELSTDNDVQAAMDKKSRLQTLCETRWVSRSDALTTFKRAFPVIVHSLESLHQDSDEKAGLNIAAVSRFEFIIALIVCEHALRFLEHLCHSSRSIMRYACNIRRM